MSSVLFVLVFLLLPVAAVIEQRLLRRMIGFCHRHCRIIGNILTWETQIVLAITLPNAGPREQMQHVTTSI